MALPSVRYPTPYLWQRREPQKRSDVMQLNCLSTCGGRAGTFPIKASESFDNVHHACLEIRRKSPPRMAEICPDHRSEEFHSPESVQHPAFYRCLESYPRRNGSPRNCYSRAGDERSAVPVSV